MLSSSWCSWFLCIGIFGSCWDPKGLFHCATNFLTVCLGVVQWAETVLHAHLLSWFQRTPQVQRHRSCWGGCFYPQTQQGPAGKPGKEIIPLDLRHDHHECLFMSLLHWAPVQSQKRKVLLDHRSIPPNADARNRLDGFLSFLFFWLREHLGKGLRFHMSIMYI